MNNGLIALLDGRGRPCQPGRARAAAVNPGLDLRFGEKAVAKFRA
jgi:hypothetical protein